MSCEIRNIGFIESQKSKLMRCVEKGWARIVNRGSGMNREGVDGFKARNLMARQKLVHKIFNPDDDPPADLQTQ